MKKIVSILIVFCFVYSCSSKASVILPLTDTIPGKPYKISHQQFLQRFGRDDTARAIINYYFRQRKVSLWQTMIATGLGTFGFIVFDALFLKDSSGVSLAGALLALMLAGFIWAAGIFILFSIYLFIHYSRKRLLKILNHYFSGQGIYWPGKGIPLKLRRQLYDKKF